MRSERNFSIEQIFATPITKEAQFPKDTVIYRIGDTADTLNFVKSGIVNLRRENTAFFNIIDVAKEGEIFGSDSLYNSINNDTRTTSAQAHSYVEIYSIEAKKLMRVLEKVPSAAYPILGLIARALERAENHANLMKNSRSPARLATAILEYTEDGIALVGQHTLADRSGMNRVTVSRELGQFAKSNIIDNSKPEIIKVLNLESLTAQASERLSTRR